MTTSVKTPAVAVEFTLEQFNIAVTKMAKAQESSVKAVGNVILMALYFANAKADAGAANALIKNLRKSTKQQGIIALLEENGNLAWMKTAKQPHFEVFAADHEWTPETVKALRVICEDWESYKPTPEAKTEYDLVKVLRDALKKADKAQEDHMKVNGDVLVEDLRKLVAAFGAKALDRMIGA